MSKLEIIVLGMLNRNKMYGYEIVKFFKDTDFYLWMNIKLPSIYKVLDRMSQKSFISKKKVIQEDGIPKNEFTITEEGKKVYLSELKKFVTKKNSINFYEFIFFTLIMEKAVTKDTFLEAINIQITQFNENSLSKNKKHQALRKMFPNENFIMKSIGRNFSEIRKIYLQTLNEIKENINLPESSSYFLSEDGK